MSLWLSKFLYILFFVSIIDDCVITLTDVHKYEVKLLDNCN